MAALPEQLESAGDDFVLPFQIAETAVRGRLVRLSGSIDTILKAHDFPTEISDLVGEAAALVSMMGSALKFDGKLILQAQGDGPASLVVADYASDGRLRATAKFNEEATPFPRGAGALLGSGHIAFTIDQGPDMDRYQGVTPIEGVDFAEIAASYFDQSEQISTIIKLAVGRVAAPGGAERWRAGGVMAQFVPGEGGERGERIAMSADDEETWARAAAFIETTQADELLDPSISAETLLYRLFHEDGVRVFDPQPVRAACGCNQEKIAAVLKGYSEEDLADMVEDGVITVTCEFCRADYRFLPNGAVASAS